MEREGPARTPASKPRPASHITTVETTARRVAEPPASVELPRRFYASADLDPDRVGRDAGKIADEILSHLSTLPRASLRVSIEIEVEMPEGASEDVQRTVSENAGVLKFKSHGFERE